jgi:hypothetical protein
VPDQSGNVLGVDYAISEGTLTKDACQKLLERLPAMSRPELQELWAKLFGRPPHPKLRRQLMVPILAYRAQEKTYGGLKASTRKYLLRLAQQIERKRPAKLPGRIKPGTKLIRQWHGETHEVLVAERGYLYRGVEYRTLSEIAELITGAHWSGPAFFGLRKRGKQEAA